MRNLKQPSLATLGTINPENNTGYLREQITCVVSGMHNLWPSVTTVAKNVSYLLQYRILATDFLLMLYWSDNSHTVPYLLPMLHVQMQVHFELSCQRP